MQNLCPINLVLLGISPVLIDAGDNELLFSGLQELSILRGEVDDDEPADGTDDDSDGTLDDEDPWLTLSALPSEHRVGLGHQQLHPLSPPLPFRRVRTYAKIAEKPPVITDRIQNPESLFPTSKRVYQQVMR